MHQINDLKRNYLLVSLSKVAPTVVLLAKMVTFFLFRFRSCITSHKHQPKFLVRSNFFLSSLRLFLVSWKHVFFFFLLYQVSFVCLFVRLVGRFLFVVNKDLSVFNCETPFCSLSSFHSIILIRPEGKQKWKNNLVSDAQDKVQSIEKIYPLH